jgi:hypothetical protein
VLFCRIALMLARPHRWLIVAALAGALVGYRAHAQAELGRQDRERVKAWADQLSFLAHQSGGAALVFSTYPGHPYGSARDYELTARILWAWPRARRERFWAYHTSQLGERIFGPRSHCRTQRIHVAYESRRLYRSSDTEVLLWVTPYLDDRLSIEPYCLPPN